MKTTLGYTWESVNGWKGGAFKLPPKDFAPDLGVRGREVLRFSPGFYKPGAEDFWSYAFVFLTPDLDKPTSSELQSVLHRYFLGLGRNLGSARNPTLAPASVVVRAVDSNVVDSKLVDAQARTLAFNATVFDSFKTGQAVELNVSVIFGECDGGTHRQVFVAASPLPRDHAIWRALLAEKSAVRCWTSSKEH